MSVEQQKTKLLGYPYQSECLEAGHQMQYFSRYSDRHCYQGKTQKTNSANHKHKNVRLK